MNFSDTVVQKHEIYRKLWSATETITALDHTVERKMETSPVPGSRQPTRIKEKQIRRALIAASFKVYPPADRQ